MALCSSCRQTLLRRLMPSQSQSLRYISTATSNPPTSSATPPSPTSSSNAPDTTSSSHPTGAQPFSSPHFAPASVTKVLNPAKNGPRTPSRIAGGTELKGLGYVKATPSILAKEDDEYPPWLWSLLSQPQADGTEAAKFDVASMTKKRREKYDRKQERLRKTMPKAIPLHEQSADLTGPGDSAFTSLEKREELTKSARMARRKEIREDNFLRSM